MAKVKNEKLPAHTLRYWAQEQYRHFAYNGRGIGVRKTVQGAMLQTVVHAGRGVVECNWLDEAGTVHVKEMKIARSWLY